MDIKDLKTLIKMVTETDITEFEMENTEEKISIRRGKTQEIVHVTAPAQMAAPAMAAAPVMQAPVAPAPAAPAAGPVLGERQEIINSPIVGTFYRAPSPESASYVEVGSIVEKGQVFCIVEAMKLMNEIEADFKCKVVEILKENAQPVEFGDPLFVVEKL
ncbi:MAG: acetyl-CoA carboxylase biotin carboxyl carrier protein [Desulfuromonadales bacterium]|nr:acetyl-CoA carboxylase biotin carboxyl carrier protein [Desulfuromonadales bacterium]MDW7756809.1 acetyl-CoA carboxylase biotin carboxyl carrier protein [Desulfuromonadales bacterium]